MDKNNQKWDPIKFNQGEKEEEDGHRRGGGAYKKQGSKASKWVGTFLVNWQ